jgi:lactose/L-arabinose transport system permease protein
MNLPLRQRVWNYRHFYLFISPFFILFAVFGLYPILFSLYLSLVKWNGLTDRVFVGFENFRKLFQDPYFYHAIWNTLIIGVYHIPPMFIGAFLLAVLLNRQTIKLRGFFRAAVFVPCITPTVVIAIVFLTLFGTELGVVNYFLGFLAHLFHLPFSPIRWLDSESLSKVTVSILLVWRWTGYNTVLMLAGMQGIPEELYEAATIDGAGRLQRMWHITVPLLRPTFIFCSVTSLIGTVYMFDETWVLTAGGPGDSSTNFGVYLFNEGFTDFRFGFASAAAYSVAAVVFVLSLILLRTGKRGTH